MKRLLVSFAIAGALLANTKGGSKSYTINIVDKTLIGASEVKPGLYEMKLEGSEAVFVDDQRREIVKAPVTLSTVTRKFTHTELVCSQAPDNSDRLDAIRLQGTKTELELKY
jgi:hypothetical protein